MNLRVAKGQAYPTNQRTLHGRSILPGFLKVQVDTVDAAYGEWPAPSETQTDEIMYMKDTRSQFIQWPRKAIKVYLI